MEGLWRDHSPSFARRKRELLIACNGAGLRVEASVAQGSDAFFCPGCQEPVILKQGHIRIAHYAHHRYAACPYSVGETEAHLEAKIAFRDAIRAQGQRAEVEWQLEDQRADVAGWSQDGRLFVIELQHTELQIDTLKARIAGYRQKTLPQLWLPLLQPSIFEDHGDKRFAAITVNNGLFVERYPIRLFERYLAKMYLGNLWCYDSVYNGIRFVNFGNYKMYHKEGSSGEFAGEYYNAVTYSDYEYTSRRWREIKLSSLNTLDHIKLRLSAHSYLGIELSVPLITPLQPT